MLENELIVKTVLGSSKMLKERTLPTPTSSVHFKYWRWPKVTFDVALAEIPKDSIHFSSVVPSGRTSIEAVNNARFSAFSFSFSKKPKEPSFGEARKTRLSGYSKENLYLSFLKVVQTCLFSVFAISLAFTNGSEILFF